MSCKSMSLSDGTILHINYGPKTEERPLRKRRRLKWCFDCRKRLPHMLTASVPIEPSYYEPNVWWKCSGCGHDRTSFPGFKNGIALRILNRQIAWSSPMQSDGL